MHREVHPLGMFLEVGHAAHVPLDLDRLRLAHHAGEDCIICFGCSLEHKILAQMGPCVAGLALVVGGGVIRTVAVIYLYGRRNHVFLFGLVFRHCWRGLLLQTDRTVCRTDSSPTEPLPPPCHMSGRRGRDRVGKLR